MAMKTIKKVLKQAPLVGNVINSLKSNNPEENAPSIQAVLDNLRPIQLLINNDFLINQRGQSEYNFNKNGRYGLDMWMCRQGNYYGACKVSQIKGGGCKIVSSVNAGMGIRQYIEGGNFTIGKTYTASTKINNVVYSGTATLTNDETFNIINNDVFSLTFFYDEESDRVVYSIWFKTGNAEYIVEYVDLFEGEIAYPHRKEDYAIALMRCQLYFIKGKYVGIINYEYSTSDNKYYYKVCFTYGTMANTPSFNFIDMYYYNSSGMSEHVTLKSIDGVNNGYIEFSTSDGSKKSSEVNAVLCNVEISCEP